MKKSVALFIVFLIAFGTSLVFIYFKANDTANLSEQNEPLEWHGRVENEFGTYNGVLIGDLFYGQGDFSFLSGETYVGEWQDSYMSGNGTVSFPGIGEYIGELKESKRNGQGQFTWYSGEKYEGNWINDEMSGQGKYTFLNGSEIEGIFENNKPVSGKLIYSIELNESAADTEIISLEYTFSDEQQKVIFTTKGGLKYEGDISGLYNEGNAVITYPSGNVYDGHLLTGKREGAGKYSWVDDSGKVTSYYDGNWQSDHMSGQGKYHYSSSEFPYLYGTFDNDTPAGELVYYKESGNTFTTTWENGLCINVKES